MTFVTCDLAVSLDGFVAGPEQTREAPLGKGGQTLHRWRFEQPEQHEAELAAITDAGAFIMGRNMFAGPGAGPWDASWTGWWGDDPPYHAPVFVLTRHGREALTKQGGTTFHFVPDGVHAAYRLAAEAAGERTVSVAGGASTVNQFLAAGLIDELRLHVAPVLLGDGARLFDGIPGLRATPVASRHTDLVTHITYRLERS